MMAEMQNSKPSHDNIFYISDCHILAKILVIKASHVLSPEWRGREVYSMSGVGGQVLQTHRAQGMDTKGGENLGK